MQAVNRANEASQRILVCGDYISGQPLAHQCADAFERLGWRVARVNSEDRRRWLPEAAKRWSKSLAKLAGLKPALSAFYSRREQEARNRPAREALAGFAPHAVLVIRGNGLLPDVLREMRARGVITIGWWIKDVRRVEQMLAERPLYDLYFCIHRNLSRGDIAYLPAFAADPNRAPLPPAPGAYRFDVAFAGIWTEKRQQYLEGLADVRLGIVGPGWYRRNALRNRRLAGAVVAPRLLGADLLRFYHSARIVVNIHQWEAQQATGTTLRVADVPACGALLLTEYSAGVEEVFTPGRELVVFSSPRELREKVHYYLAHEAERAAIAAAGRRAAFALPTHEDRMRTVVSALAAHRAAAAAGAADRMATQG